MVIQHYQNRWRIIGASVRGPLHIRHGLPNQDAVMWQPLSSDSALTTTILAVSDGHGGPLNFRSNVGAYLAVSLATQTCHEFLLQYSEHDDPSYIKTKAESELPVTLVNRWFAAVADHWANNPFLPAELSAAHTAGAHVRRLLEANWRLAYGATLLIVMVTQTFVLYLQLGDGDILTVSETGLVTRPPIPNDQRVFGNATTSLCADHAWLDFRVAMQDLTDESPVLILAATDGYSNSFRSELDFLQVGSDISSLLCSGSVKITTDHLVTWLEETTTLGSGDDITVGIIYRELL